MRICEICGKEYTPTSNNQKYCPICGPKQARKRYKKYYQAHLEQRKEVARKYEQAHREQIREYYREYRKANIARIREYQKNYQKVWAKNHADRIREYRKKCPNLYASKKFYQTHAEKVKQYQKEYHQTHPEIAYTIAARRRVRLENATVEEVDPHYICKRDNWVCQICGKKVNPKYKWPHPLSASIDHIIPISKGGTHERKNLQLAHLECNLKKHNGGHDQLRLIG
jgi:hypothetical protein